MRETETRLYCDGCGSLSDYESLNLISVAEFFKAMRELGWVRRRGGRTTDAGDYCPKCSGRAK